MTINEVKKYLNGARNIKKQLMILEKSLSNIVENEINLVPSYGKEYVDNSAISRPTEEAAVKLEQIRERIQNKKIDYSNILFDRVELIDDALPISSVDNMVFKERYINSMSWNNIAKKTFYSVKYLMRIHSRGIKRITKFINTNSHWGKRIREE